MEFDNIRFVRVDRKTRIAFDAYRPVKGDERYKYLGVFSVPMGTPVRDFQFYVRKQLTA